MDPEDLKTFDFTIDPDEPLFIIGVVSHLVEIPIWTLRKLDQMQIVIPQRVGKKTRCYSKRQIQQLQYVSYLMEEKGVNISGVKVILEMGKEE